MTIATLWPRDLARREAEVVDDLEIRPMRAPAAWRGRYVALHCAEISMARRVPRKRLVPRLYLYMAALPAIALAAILFAGAVARALRWAVML